jgi:hypothetical protein
MSANIDGTNNTSVGYLSGVSSGSLTNASAFGYFARSDASDKIVIGNASVTIIGGYAGWSTLSDGRFKKEVENNIPGLAFISELRPVSYRMDLHKLDKFIYGDEAEAYERNMAAGIAAKEKIVYSGFIAQEVEAAARKIGYNFSGVVPPPNEKGHYSLTYSEFVVPMVKAIQEQQQMIEKLQKDNEELKVRLDKLEKNDNR